jgi:hypothetical protein
VAQVVRTRGDAIPPGNVARSKPPVTNGLPPLWISPSFNLRFIILQSD